MAKRVFDIMAGVASFEEQMELRAQADRKKEMLITRALRTRNKPFEMPALSTLVGIHVRNLVPIIRRMVHMNELRVVRASPPPNALYPEKWVDKFTVVTLPRRKRSRRN